MTDDSCVVAGGASECAAVPNLLLNIADDGTLRALANGENVADGELGLLAGVDEGTSVETLSCNESFLAELVAVGIAENNAGKRSTTVLRSTAWRKRNVSSNDAPARIVDDLLHNTLNVTIALGEVESTELGRSLVVMGVGLELLGEVLVF